MWAIVGLGNPGRKYLRTRHNVGFLVLEELAARYGIELKEINSYKAGKGSLEGVESVLMEPLTFMNRSGTAVRDIVRKFSVAPHELVVIHDDLDMETGRLKIKQGGGTGGHRGVKSIVESLGSRDFIRIKIGIGRDEYLPVEDYVLSKFSRSEMPMVKDTISAAADAVAALVTEGVDYAMNLYNKKT